jgi:hypothetical protein
MDDMDTRRKPPVGLAEADYERIVAHAAEQLALRDTRVGPGPRTEAWKIGTIKAGTAHDADHYLRAALTERGETGEPLDTDNDAVAWLVSCQAGPQAVNAETMVAFVEALWPSQRRQRADAAVRAAGEELRDLRAQRAAHRRLYDEEQAQQYYGHTIRAAEARLRGLRREAEALKDNPSTTNFHGLRAAMLGEQFYGDRCAWGSLPGEDAGCDVHDDPDPDSAGHLLWDHVPEHGSLPGSHLRRGKGRKRRHKIVEWREVRKRGEPDPKYRWVCRRHHAVRTSKQQRDREAVKRAAREAAAAARVQAEFELWRDREGDDRNSMGASRGRGPGCTGSGSV